MNFQCPIKDSRVLTAEQIKLRGNELFSEREYSESVRLYLSATEIMNESNLIAALMLNLSLCFAHMDCPRQSLQFAISAGCVNSKVSSKSYARASFALEQLGYKEESLFFLTKFQEQETAYSQQSQMPKRGEDGPLIMSQINVDGVTGESVAVHGDDATEDEQVEGNGALSLAASLVLVQEVVTSIKEILCVVNRSCSSTENNCSLSRDKFTLLRSIFGNDTYKAGKDLPSPSPSFTIGSTSPAPPAPPIVATSISSTDWSVGSVGPMPALPATLPPPPPFSFSSSNRSSSNSISNTEEQQRMQKEAMKSYGQLQKARTIEMKDMGDSYVHKFEFAAAAYLYWEALNSTWIAANDTAALYSNIAAVQLRTAENARRLQMANRPPERQFFDTVIERAAALAAVQIPHPSSEAELAQAAAASPSEAVLAAFTSITLATRSNNNTSYSDASPAREKGKQGLVSGAGEAEAANALVFIKSCHRAATAMLLLFDISGGENRRCNAVVNGGSVASAASSGSSSGGMDGGILTDFVANISSLDCDVLNSVHNLADSVNTVCEQGQMKYSSIISQDSNQELLKESSTPLSKKLKDASTALTTLQKQSVALKKAIFAEIVKRGRLSEGPEVIEAREKDQFEAFLSLCGRSYSNTRTTVATSAADRRVLSETLMKSCLLSFGSRCRIVHVTPRFLHAISAAAAAAGGGDGGEEEEDDAHLQCNSIEKHRFVALDCSSHILNVCWMLLEDCDDAELQSKQVLGGHVEERDTRSGTPRTRAPATEEEEKEEEEEEVEKILETMHHLQVEDDTAATAAAGAAAKALQATPHSGIHLSFVESALKEVDTDLTATTASAICMSEAHEDVAGDAIVGTALSLLLLQMLRTRCHADVILQVMYSSVLTRRALGELINALSETALILLSERNRRQNSVSSAVPASAAAAATTKEGTDAQKKRTQLAAMPDSVLHLLKSWQRCAEVTMAVVFTQGVFTSSRAERADFEMAATPAQTEVTMQTKKAVGYISTEEAIKKWKAVFVGPNECPNGHTTATTTTNLPNSSAITSDAAKTVCACNIGELLAQYSLSATTTTTARDYCGRVTSSAGLNQPSSSGSSISSSSSSSSSISSEVSNIPQRLRVQSEMPSLYKYLTTGALLVESLAKQRSHRHSTGTQSAAAAAESLARPVTSFDSTVCANFLLFSGDNTSLVKRVNSLILTLLRPQQKATAETAAAAAVDGREDSKITCCNFDEGLSVARARVKTIVAKIRSRELVLDVQQLQRVKP